MIALMMVHLKTELTKFMLEKLIVLAHLVFFVDFCKPAPYVLGCWRRYYPNQPYFTNWSYTQCLCVFGILFEEDFQHHLTNMVVIFAIKSGKLFLPKRLLFCPKPI